MASADQCSEAPERRRDDASEAPRKRNISEKSAVESTVEAAAKVYFEFCRKAARTINRLKREQ
jgi:hypothetical protein